MWTLGMCFEANSEKVGINTCLIRKLSRHKVKQYGVEKHENIPDRHMLSQHIYQLPR